MYCVRKYWLQIETKIYEYNKRYKLYTMVADILYFTDNGGRYIVLYRQWHAYIVLYRQWHAYIVFVQVVGFRINHVRK